MKKSNLLADAEHKIRELEQIKLILMKMMSLPQFTLNTFSRSTKPAKNIESKNKIIGFRIPETTLEKLETQAKNQGKNINILVREILKKHTEWDEIYSKFDPIIVPKSIFDLLLDGSNEKKIDEITNALQGVFLDLVLMKSGTTNFAVIISGIEDFLKDINNEYEHVLLQNGHHLSILCQPDTIFGNLLQKLLRHVLSKFVSEHKIEFTVTQNLFKITWME